MARSMTGWGRADFAVGADQFAMEIKSLNHRFLDISVRSPERLSSMEIAIREEIKKRFARGSFTVHIYPVSSETPSVRLNLPMARLYMEAAAELGQSLGVKGEMDLDALLRQKDIFTVDRKAQATEADLEAVKAALAAASAQLEEWRSREGEALKADLLGRLATLEGCLFTIEVRIPKMIESYRERLKAEMEKILLGKADENRILLEAAIFAEKTDTAEEVTRLKSHFEMFRKMLGVEEPAGKKLDFLCQELGREINTIGSKANDTSITQTVIEMKGELEKIREQVQNVE